MNLPAAISRRIEFLLALVLAILGNLLFFHFALRAMPYFRDFSIAFYPMKVFLTAQLRQGRIPLWDPTQNLGMPFLANPITGCFYPFNFLFMFLSPLEGLRYYLLLHYPLAAVGMFLWLRDLSLRPAAAALGAMTFSWSGYLVAQHCNLIYLISPCYFPWALLLFRRLALEASWAWAMAAGLSIALPFLAGEPQGAALAGILGSGYTLFTAFGAGVSRGAAPLSTPLSSGAASGKITRAASKGRTLARLAVAFLFSAGLSMIQFLPSWELRHYSERAQGFTLDQASYFSLHPLRLLELFWPNLWGLPWPENHFWGGFLSDSSYSLFFSLGLYLGLWPLLCAVLAYRRANPGPPSEKRQVYFFSLVTLFGLLLALGRYTPFYAGAYHLIPGFRWFRSPEKYLALLSLGIAALASLGFNSWLGRFPSNRAFVWAVRFWLGTLVGLALIAWLGQSGLETWFDHFLRQPGTSSIRAAAATESLLWALTRSAAAAVVLGLFLEIYRAAPRRRNGLAALLLAMTAGDLYSAQRQLVPTASTSLYTTPSEAAELMRYHQSNPRERFRFYRDAALTFTASGAEAQLQSHLWQRDTLGPNWVWAYGLEDFGGYTPAQLNQIEPLWEQGMTHDLLRSFNIKYLLVPLVWSQFDAEPGVQNLETDPDRNLRILLYGGYFPRAYLVPRARAVATEKDALSRLLTLDFKQEVVLLTSEVLPGASENGSLVPAEVKQSDSDRVVLEVRSEHPGWLVLTDSYFPGWEARVNGKPAQIYRANYLARAVRVEAGRSEIVFVYRPQSYLWGRAITLATLGLALVGILVGVVLRKLAPPPQVVKTMTP
jgi:hypothetical protein